MDPLHRLFATGKLSPELRFFHLFEDYVESWPVRKSHRDQIPPAQQGFWMNLFFFQFRKFLFAKAVVLKIAVGGERIDARQFQKFVDSILTEKTLERAEPHLGSLHMAQVIAHQVGNPLPGRSTPL